MARQREILDLCNKIGFHPLNGTLLRPVEFRGKGCGGHSALLEFCSLFSGLGLRKACTHASGVDQLVAIVIAEHQGAYGIFDR
jgi:hypothetical protein